MTWKIVVAMLRIGKVSDITILRGFVFRFIYWSGIGFGFAAQLPIAALGY